MMDSLLIRGHGAKNSGGCDGGATGHDLNPTNTLVVIKLPDSRVLRIVSRSLLVAMILLALPSIGSVIKRASRDIERIEADSNGFTILPILLRDLLDEGLIKKGHKGFVMGGADATSNGVDGGLQFLRNAGVDLRFGGMKAAAHEVFDFILLPNFRGIQFIDNILKEGSGLVISPLGHDPSNHLRNYKFVYLRKFDSTVVAMRKKAGASASSSEKRVLCDDAAEEKKAALQGLEDVYLEPPRRTTLSKKSSFTSRKIKFLPDLMKDSLDEYPRRVFISDDSTALDWFYKNYPMRDQEFQVYDVGAGENNDGSFQETGVSTWLKKRVRREDYVVMKAEAQVVEEMIKDKTLLCLVDELFLECKNQWQENGSKRAYWQCLALYGKVRDEGIAVHQWWN